MTDFDDNPMRNIPEAKNFWLKPKDGHSKEYEGHKSCSYRLVDPEGDPVDTRVMFFVTEDDAIDGASPIQRLHKDLYGLHQTSDTFEDGDTILVEWDGQTHCFRAKGVHIKHDGTLPA